MISKNAFVLLLGATTGCATSSTTGEPTPAQAPATPNPTPGSTPAPADPAALSRVDENLGKLRALAVFEVGALVVDAPEGAYSCYGVCPEHREAVTAAEQKSAGRLEKLVAAATAAAPDKSPATCERAAIDGNLAALKNLRIADIGALIEDKPEAKPSCYNQPCSGDIEAAKAKNCERAAKLAGIAAAAKNL